MKRFGITCALGALCGWMALGQSPVPVMVNPTNNAVVVPDWFWPSNRLALLSTLSLETSINGGTPNGSGALVHWSQLLGVPAGFADGADDGAGGGAGTMTGISFATQAGMPFFWSPTSTTTTNQFALNASNQVANLVYASPSTGSGAPAFRALMDADLPLEIPRLADSQTFTGLTNAFAGTVNIPGTLNASTQNVSELNIATLRLGTNIVAITNGGTGASTASAARASLGTDVGDNITSGTIADARLALSIARLDSPAFTNFPTAPTAAENSSNSVIATTAYTDRAARAVRSPQRNRLVLFEKDWVTATVANAGLPELTGTAVSSATAAIIASEPHHLGIVRLSSSTTSNSAYYYLSGISGLFAQPLLTWESISRVRATNSGVRKRYGFHDSATVANPTDGILILRSNNFLIPQIWFNAALVQGFEYPVQSNQFVYLRFQVSTNMTNVTFHAEDSDTKTLILSTNLNSTLPADSNRSFAVGHLAVSTNAVALQIEDLDWSTAYIDSEVNR